MSKSKKTRKPKAPMKQDKPLEVVNQDVADTLMEFRWFTAGDKMRDDHETVSSKSNCS
jgi:hypothetical protein